MISANFVLLGDASIAGELGKKGTETDISFYERKTSDKILTFIVPSGFPEKIQPLVQAIALCEYAILNVKNIDKSLGEQIVALDSLGMRNGFILANGFDDQIKKFISGTVLENYSFVSLDELKRQVEDVKEISAGGRTKVVIDAAFEVKGVGTIALGVVKRGILKAHDELQIYPADKKVSVRSVQMHDDDVESAASPGRVGVALKGVTSNEIVRGDVIAESGSVECATEINIDFVKNGFYKSEIKPEAVYHACVGLQIVPAKIDQSKLKTEKPLAFEKGETVLLLDLNSDSIRIVGKGNIL